MDQQVIRDPQVFRDQLDPQVFREKMEFKVLRVIKDPPEIRETLVKEVRLDLSDQQVFRDQLDPQVIKDQQVKEEKLEFKVLLEIKV